MRLLKHGAFAFPISSLGIALFLSAALILPSAIILSFTVAKLDTTFSSVTHKRIVPLSIGLIVIAIVSSIFFYVLAIKSKGIKNE